MDHITPHIPQPRVSVARDRRERQEDTDTLIARLPGLTGAERRQVIDQLILVNRPVADSIASRYCGRGVAGEDVHQVACEGLVKAVQRFDPERHTDLLVFAVPTIRGEIKRHFRDRGWSVRPPRRVQELQQRLSRAREELAHELGREPERHEVAARLDLSLTEVDEAWVAFGAFTPMSLDQPVSDEQASFAESWGELDPGMAAAEARTMLAPVLETLTERERKILHLRFFEEQTQAEIGEALGVTQMQVSRLLSALLRRMRTALESPRELASR
jgi:RNA polymerase sigma-B factor